MAHEESGHKFILIAGVAVAAYIAYEYLFAGTSTAAAASVPVGAAVPSGASSAGATQSTAVPVSSASTATGPTVLDQAYAALVAYMTSSAQSDPQITLSGNTVSASPAVFNFYLAALPQSPLPGSPNPPSSLFTSQSPITSAAYWSATAPALRSQFGLAGIGAFAGLGAIGQYMRGSR